MAVGDAAVAHLRFIKSAKEELRILGSLAADPADTE